MPLRPPQTGLHEEMHNRNILRHNGLNTVPRAGHSSLRIGRHEKNTEKTATSTCANWLRETISPYRETNFPNHIYDQQL